MRYVCSICGYVYDEAGNTPWAVLPENWKCPLCGAARSDFNPEEKASSKPAETSSAALPETDIRPLNAAEASALCSNLAKGCEKQYQAEQAESFRKLAAWFNEQKDEPADPSFGRLLDLINSDLSAAYPAANAYAGQIPDRGALRSLTWGEKVTRILKSILERHAREGNAMLENTGVYVCTICGFVYIGNNLPDVCPVCKVPNRKFEKIGG